jgi:riboflavin biosynthesis pyrimidine reductase
MERLLPAPGGPDARADEDDAAALCGWLAREYAFPGGGVPCVRACMVASLDGAAHFAGRSGGLSSPADQALLGVLRALADVVLVGAGTARAEGYGPVEPHPFLTRAAPAPLAVVATTLTGLRPELLASPSTLIIAPESSPAARATDPARLVPAGPGPHADLPLALRALHTRGLHAIHTEGGPALLGALLSADLVDEVSLTYAPVMLAGAAGRIAVSASPTLRRLALRGVCVADDGFLFTRYARG